MLKYIRYSISPFFPFFRFIKNPEFLKVGQRLVFREGRTKAVGNVTRLFPHEIQPSPARRVKMKKPQEESLADGVGTSDVNVSIEPPKPAKRRGGHRRYVDRKPKVEQSDNVVTSAPTIDQN